jgi:membrane protein implicated in regulation of membrane protease activity
MIVAALWIPYTLFNLVGEFWLHMVYGAVVEVVLLLLIIRYAWKWPKQES